MFLLKNHTFTLYLTLTILIILNCSSDSTNLNHARVPGIIIAHSPASTQKYIGSPSIAILPNGSYVASHDFFGKGTTHNQTHIYLSKNRGQSWEKISTINGQFWSNLFIHAGVLYILGPNKQNGFVIIRRSNDGGKNWTEPIDSEHGLLLADGEYHCAPMQVVEHNGRLWRSMEQRKPPEGWGRTFQSFVMSVSVDADLLNAKNWLFSERLPYNPEWSGGAWLEGNIVVTPDGKIVNILRNHTETGGRAAIIHVAEDGKTVFFDPQTGFINFPGGSKKFLIRFDPKSNLYWALCNYIPEKYEGHNPERTRNTLALIASTNLIDWHVTSIILQHPNIEKTGFQYPDWLFDGEDIIAVVRTAFDDGIGGAHNCHDANYLTFHRIKNFRTLTLDEFSEK
jgi:hypothetical protein